MLEAHSWMTIRESSDPEDFEWNIKSIVDKIEKRIHELKWVKMDINVMNGAYYAEFTMFHNRSTEKLKELLQLYRYVGQISQDSYGMIYVFDDEDFNGRQNEFQVFVLAKGALISHKDIYLSPVIPTIEDE